MKASYFRYPQQVRDFLDLVQRYVRIEAEFLGKWFTLKLLSKPLTQDVGVWPHFYSAIGEVGKGVKIWLVIDQADGNAKDVADRVGRMGAEWGYHIAYRKPAEVAPPAAAATPAKKPARSKRAPAAAAAPAAAEPTASDKPAKSKRKAVKS